MTDTPETFSVGDVVRLRCGGPTMVVTGRGPSRETSECVWFDVRLRHCQWRFLNAVLARHIVVMPSPREVVPLWAHPTGFAYTRARYDAHTGRFVGWEFSQNAVDWLSLGTPVPDPPPQP